MPRFRPIPVLALLLSACSGPAPLPMPVPEPVLVEPPAPEGVPFRALYAEAGRVVAHDLAGDARRDVSSFAGAVVGRYPSPAGGAVVAVARDGDSLAVWLVGGADERTHRLAALAAPVETTVAWSPDGTNLAFGHYVPTTRDARPAMGAGDILRVDPATGVAARVGCQAARAVLAWMGPDELLVRDTNNLYVVALDGCATRSTVDARRMHRLSVAPDGRHVAYVHRELVYNRQRRAYEPDSTLRIAAPDGADERTVVAFRYRPERLAWKADGTEFAYDVEHPDRPGVRVISIYDVASGQNAYLHPPTADGPSEFAPSWSPGGTRLAYRTAGSDGAVRLAVRTFADPFPTVLEGSEGAGLVGWAGENAVAARLPAGVARVWRLDGGMPFDLPVGADPIVVAPR